MNSKISVIIPIYNKEKYIEQCLKSVVNQTYSNLEIIIIDDASQDKSVEIARSIKDERIKILELKENVGAGIARNKGIEIANRRLHLLYRCRRLLGFGQNRKTSEIYGRE